MSSTPPWTDPSALVDKARAIGVTLREDAATEVLAYLDAMLQTNEHINLTAVRDREAAVVLHVLDSLAFQLTELRPRHLLDLGTGNGFPGVGVAALWPQATATLMDKTGKKVRAIGGCLVAAGLDRIETLQMDARQAPALRRDFRHGFDLCTARAVARPDVVADLAEPLVRPGGHLVMWLETDADAPAKLGRFQHERTVRYELPEPAARTREQVVWKRG
ncbi:MAG: 16S rRNA (guanine(527)-N(7))-methyltransferase RsmG [Planctomycetota bacterium]